MFPPGGVSYVPALVCHFVNAKLPEPYVKMRMRVIFILPEFGLKLKPLISVLLKMSAYVFYVSDTIDDSDF